MDLEKIHPVNFFKNEILQNSEIGNCELDPIYNEITLMNNPNYSPYIQELIRDFTINNITGLSTTFIIKLLEDNIDKDEIAYIVDFYQYLNMNYYLSDIVNRSLMSLHTIEDNNSICNIIESGIIFIINQFIQFYTMNKLVYSNEGVDLYKHLYKSTYDEDPKNTIRIQDKYVFCNCILNSILENMIPDIRKCCESLNEAIYNIKNISMEVINNGRK